MRSRLLLPQVALLVCCTLVAGCIRWQELDPPAPASSIERARVELQDGRLVLVDNLSQQGDSLTGLLPNSSAPGQPPLRFAVGRSEVVRVYQRQSSLPRTVAAVTLPVLLAVASIYLLGY